MKYWLITWLLVFSGVAHAGEAFNYKHGKTELEGYLALPETKRKTHPAVLIVHDWMGLSDHYRKKADEMAAKGYIALAVDVYGKGIRPKDTQDAATTAERYKTDPQFFRERMKAALRALQARPDVDKDQIVAFGYCFGGTAVLELARAGAKLAGVASFHGGLGTVDPKDAKKIKTKVIVFHGAIDPFVSAEEIATFQKEMNEAKVDYQFISYSGAVHSFTHPHAGNDPSKGAAYNKAADQRSWKAFEQFLEEVAPL